MPPAPRLIVSVDEMKLKALCDIEDVPMPTVKIVNQAKGVTVDGREALSRGDYQRGANRIRVFLDLNGRLEAERLPFVNSSLVFTLLHEFRHHWQEYHWTAEEWAADSKRAYAHQKCEKDANEFADLHKAKYRSLIRVKRVFHGSGFSKLGKTEAAVRRLAS